MKFLVADLFTAGLEIPRGKWLYTVTVDSIPLYVGKSVDPRRRLHQHFEPPGCIAWHASPLTELARDNWDEAQQWNIELTPVEGDLAEAEAARIRELRPCLNVQYSVGSHRIPERLLAERRVRDRERIANIRNKLRLL